MKRVAQFTDCIISKMIGWEEPSRRDKDKDDFSDWDPSRGNGSSSQHRKNDDDSDLRYRQ